MMDPVSALEYLFIWLKHTVRVYRVNIYKRFRMETWIQLEANVIRRRRNVILFFQSLSCPLKARCAQLNKNKIYQFPDTTTISHFGYARLEAATSYQITTVNLHCDDSNMNTIS